MQKRFRKLQVYLAMGVLIYQVFQLASALKHLNEGKSRSVRLRN